MKKSLNKDSKPVESRTTQNTSKTQTSSANRVTQPSSKTPGKIITEPKSNLTANKAIEGQDTAFNITLKKESSSVKKLVNPQVPSRAANKTPERPPLPRRPPASPVSDKQPSPVKVNAGVSGKAISKSPVKVNSTNQKSAAQSLKSAGVGHLTAVGQHVASNAKRPSIVLFGAQFDDNAVDLDEAPTIKFKEGSGFGIKAKDSTPVQSKTSYQSRRDLLKDQKSKDVLSKPKKAGIMDLIKEDLTHGNISTNNTPGKMQGNSANPQKKISETKPFNNSVDKKIKELNKKVDSQNKAKTKKDNIVTTPGVISKIKLEEPDKQTKKDIAPGISSLLNKAKQDSKKKAKQDSEKKAKQDSEKKAKQDSENKAKQDSEKKAKEKIAPGISGLLKNTNHQIEKVKLAKEKEAIKPAINKLVQNMKQSKNPISCIGGVAITIADSCILPNESQQKVPARMIGGVSIVRADSITPKTDNIPEPKPKVEKKVREKMSIMVSKPEDAVKRRGSNQIERQPTNGNYSPKIQKRTSISKGIQRCQTSVGTIGKLSSSSMPSKQYNITTIDEGGSFVIPYEIRNLESLTPSRSNSMDEVGELMPPAKLNVFESAANLGVPNKSMLPDSRQRLSIMMNTNMNMSSVNNNSKKSTIPRASVMIPGFASSNKTPPVVSFSTLCVPTGDKTGFINSLLGTGDLGAPDMASKASSMIGGVGGHSMCSNISMISNIIEVSVHQAIDIPADKTRQLNEDPAFDQEGQDRGWKSWGVKTFIPVLANYRVDGMLRTHHFLTYSKEFNQIKTEYEKKGLQYSDSLFKPIMATLRGFGGDCSWE